MTLGQSLPPPLPPVKRGAGGTLHQEGFKVFDTFPQAVEPHNCIFCNCILCNCIFLQLSSHFLLWTVAAKISQLPFGEGNVGPRAGPSFPDRINDREQTLTQPSSHERSSSSDQPWLRQPILKSTVFLICWRQRDRQPKPTVSTERSKASTSNS